MTQVFVVMLEAGEYSSRSEWPWKAYRSEKEAQAECERLDEKARIVAAAFPYAIRYDDWSIYYNGRRQAFTDAGFYNNINESSYDDIGAFIHEVELIDG